MKQNEIYMKKSKLVIEKIKLYDQLKRNANNLDNLQKRCSHDIILKFDDHRLHKIGQIYQYYCPACGKWENIHQFHELDETHFKNSMIIDLSEYPEYILYDYIPTICNNIFVNYDYYYDKEIVEEEKADAIIKFINEEKQKTYIKK